MSTNVSLQPTSDLRVVRLDPLDPPDAVKGAIPLSQKAAATVVAGREAIRNVLRGRDNRLAVFVGPCSVHDVRAATEYAERLATVADRVKDELLVIQRVYFEKPRTTVGWKGLINDPRLNGSADINEGLRVARQLLLDINELGMPCATEFLDPIVPQYTADLVAWAAVGARTTESQTHREMASGLSMPVGFKNSTDGDLQIAIDAMVAARHPHSFLGIDPTGRTAIVRTSGNPDVHAVLRGGRKATNYSAASIAHARAALNASAERRLIVVDCSHGNSDKDFRRQPLVFAELLKQVVAGETAILGAMLESNLCEGNQTLTDVANLRYGVSVTDGCIGWAETERILADAHAALARSRR